ncbi:hypothetical protein HDU96_000406 [Phlyctochytrium bullatum]|nr:hypothetical protein HDU96_000406 [Phlyctochytrium bullatum]
MSSFPLSSGFSIPSVGLGTCKAPHERSGYLLNGTGKAGPNEVGEAVKKAIALGYRHFDLAFAYENEKEIGAAFKEAFASGVVDRSSLFITSKLWNTFHHPDDVPKGFEKTLSDLGLDYLDLYIIHWPLSFKNRGDGNSAKDENGKFILENIPTIDTWRAMEKLVDSGKVRTIGVSNFSATKLKELLAEARIKPAVNQVELHPYLPQHDLLEFSAKHNIHLTAYSPLGSGQAEPNLLKDEVVTEIAKKNGKTPAQVLISWAAQRGTSVIPKSSNPTRLAENLAVFALNEEDFAALNNRHKVIHKRWFDAPLFGIPIATVFD